MQSAQANNQVIWKETTGAWILFIAAAALLGVTFYAGIKDMLYAWEAKAEYSYGYLIPFISIFLVWQKKNIIEKTEFEGAWTGVLILAAGLFLFSLGSLSTITTIIQYALVISIAGMVISVMGWKSARVVIVPVLFLVFMIPLPGFFLTNLSSQLQLISSMIGVEVARFLGISVHLEGNVIDLGVYKLQVVDACSGLRYLFPLMSLSFICAYIFHGAFWKKAIIFLSSIPITVLMNSFRIGVIAVLVEYWGSSQAEGFLHDFEGWVVFMACFGIILAEIWILTKIGATKQSLSDAFNLEFPAPAPKNAEFRDRRLPRQYFVAMGLLVAATVSSLLFATRTEIYPARSDFASFPMNIGGWQGQRDSIDKIYLDVLKLDDYLLVNYTNADKSIANLYVAYYKSQSAGESAHSPRSCIPGDGWRIMGFSPYAVEGVQVGSIPLVVNRLLIQKGDSRQLVYYWFQQRGRVITNEYMVKWYLFWDALTRNRTDGTLVRLTAPVSPGSKIEEADKQLTAFTKVAVDALTNYIPD